MHESHPPKFDPRCPPTIPSAVTSPLLSPDAESLWSRRMRVKGYDRKELKLDKAFRGILN